MKDQRPALRVALRIVGAFLIAGAGIWLGAATHAQGTAPPQPGSPQDPLVSESFVSQAIRQSGEHIVRVASGKVFLPTVGTAWALIGGSASVTFPPGAGSSGGASGTGPPVTPVADLTAGKSLVGVRSGAGGFASAPVPADHLMVLGLQGVSVIAGADGAVIWVSASGGGAVENAPLASAG